MAQSSDIVVAAFDDRRQAERAAAELTRAGIPLESMDVISRTVEKECAKEAAHLSAAAAEGSIIGALSGVGTGAVAGALATLLIPGLGTVLGGGLLLGALGGAALGAAGGAFLGPFIALNLSEEESHYYANHLEEGRTIVMVKALDRQAEVRALLRRLGGREYTGTLEAANLA